MTSSHPPEVLRDLAERLRRQSRPPAPSTSASCSGVLHEITREELAAAVAAGVLELDHAATHRLGLSLVPTLRASTAKNGRVMYTPIGPPAW